MKRIRITRESSEVKFEEVSVDNTENVFFINLDPLEPHHPSIADNQLGPAPSPPSSQCFPEENYGCLIPGHENEKGKINIISDPLAAPNADSENIVKLASAIKNQQITEQIVVKGGRPPYTITDQLFEVLDSNGAVIQSGSGIGPGLQLIPTTDNKGISVIGAPIISGNYTFTFTVNDAIGGNLQQVQWKMLVA